MEPDPLFAPLGTAIERNRPRLQRVEAHYDRLTPPAPTPALSVQSPRSTAAVEAPFPRVDGRWVAAVVLVVLWAWRRLHA
jgi:hypothetical protein